MGKTYTLVDLADPGGGAARHRAGLGRGGAPRRCASRPGRACASTASSRPSAPWRSGTAPRGGASRSSTRRAGSARRRPSSACPRRSPSSGRRVLAVDLDAQANLTSSFGYDPDALDLTSENLLTDDQVQAEDVILETAIEGVHLIPADIKLCRVDVKIHEMFMRELILVNKLKHLFGHYHVVIFDCPPNLSKVTINALLASDEVVVPVETQSYSIKALSDLTNTFSLIRQKMNHTLRVWILPTKVDRTSKLAAEFLAALDQAFGERLLAGISADPEVVKAPMIYEPVTRSFPDAPAAREYSRLARFLVLPDPERDTYARSPARLAPIA